MKQQSSHKGPHPDCFYCKNTKEFEMPQAIIEAANKNDLVIFAGAGVSTENPNVFSFTFFNDIKNELQLSKKEEKIGFSELMSNFEAEKGKRELILKIKQRLDYVEAFPELYRSATSFHRELSTIFFIKEIITTNWDDYFERECGAIPIVTDSDFAFWDLPQRKVLKLHGSVNNFGSIVATNAEYIAKYKELRDSAIGGTLKHYLATKTLVFVGYSFKDEDFNKIHNVLLKSMGAIKPKLYLVSPSPRDQIKLKKLNAIQIETDATYFLKKLKEIFVEKGVIISDDKFEIIKLALEKILKEHSKIGNGKYNMKRYPDTLYLASYQDGIIHAFERILSKYKDGSYSHNHHIVRKIQSYDRGIKDKLSRKKYIDVAYIEGYKVGLMCLLMDNDVIKNFPMYYVYGYKENIFSESQYFRIRKLASKLHKAAYNIAEKWTKKLIANDAVFHHTPFLLG